MRTSLLRSLRCAALAAAFAASSPVLAAVSIGSGSAVNFADAAVDFGCSDLAIDGAASATSAPLTNIGNATISPTGSIAAGSGQITLGGNFANTGTFSAGTSTVGINDTCGTGTSQVTGSTSFYNLSVTSTTGKQLVLPANISQGATHSLTLQGTVGNLLNIVSSSAGQRAVLTVSFAAVQAIGYVNVRDNQGGIATIAPGAASVYHSIDSGDVVNWFTNAAGTPGGNGGSGSDAVATPALNGSGQWLLLTGLIAMAWRMSRRARR